MRGNSLILGEAFFPDSILGPSTRIFPPTGPIAVKNEVTERMVLTVSLANGPNSTARGRSFPGEGASERRWEGC